MALKAHSLPPQHPMAAAPRGGGGPPSVSCSPSAPLRPPSSIALRRQCRGPGAPCMHQPLASQGASALAPQAPPGRQLSCRASVDVAAPLEPQLSAEDFHKAGGSEARFLQLQAQKDAHGQEPLSSQLEPLPLRAGQLLDVVVVGCGPAGLALAGELGRQGLTVGLLGRNSPFVNTYGVWPDEFQALGLGQCIGQTWKETLLYTESDTPIRTGREYGRVDRGLLRQELIARCSRAGVKHLAADVADIEGESTAGSTVVTEQGDRIQARLVVVAAGAASGKFLKYRGGTRGVGVQTAYGVEVELESAYPYDPQAMLFMDYRDLPPADAATIREEGPFAHLPTFLYAMPSSPTTVFFEETCLAARPAMPFSVLKERLHRRLRSLGVRYSTVHEEEWSYIPVGGDLPDTSQQVLGFGAAACLIHPATGYSLTRSLMEAPGYAAAIATALRDARGSHGSSPAAAKQAWSVLWSQERKRQRAFMIFGLELILQLDVATTREFFTTFFRLPPWLWKGFLASKLSSAELLVFALFTFAVAPNGLRFQLVKHLVTDPSGAHMLQAYLGQEES